MPSERCDACGFDSDAWTDTSAIEALSELPTRWRQALAGLDNESIARRPIEAMWSIAEYTDHVRETVFGMRFGVEVSLAGNTPALDKPSEPIFTPSPKSIDIDRALAGFEHEIVELCDRLAGLAPDDWDTTLLVGDDVLDIHWMARHALHDVTHHIDDVARLRVALNRTT